MTRPDAHAMNEDQKWPAPRAYPVPELLDSGIKAYGNRPSSPSRRLACSPPPRSTFAPAGATAFPNRGAIRVPLGPETSP